MINILEHRLEGYKLIINDQYKAGAVCELKFVLSQLKAQKQLTIEEKKSTNPFMSEIAIDCERILQKMQSNLEEIIEINKLLKR